MLFFSITTTCILLFSNAISCLFVQLLNSPVNNIPAILELNPFYCMWSSFISQQYSMAVLGCYFQFFTPESDTLTLSQKAPKQLFLTKTSVLNIHVVHKDMYMEQTYKYCKIFLAIVLQFSTDCQCLPEIIPLQRSILGPSTFTGYNGLSLKYRIIFNMNIELSTEPRA